MTFTSSEQQRPVVACTLLHKGGRRAVSAGLEGQKGRGDLGYRIRILRRASPVYILRYVCTVLLSVLLTSAVLLPSCPARPSIPPHLCCTACAPARFRMKMKRPPGGVCSPWGYFWMVANCCTTAGYVLYMKHATKTIKLPR